MCYSPRFSSYLISKMKKNLDYGRFLRKPSFNLEAYSKRYFLVFLSKPVELYGFVYNDQYL